MDQFAVRLASKNGHYKCLKILLEDSRVDPSTWNQYCIRNSCKEGRLECVKLLLSDPRVNPGERNNEAIRLACGEGHSEIVKLLLDHDKVDPTSLDNYAIKVACENNHPEVVRILVKDERIDPSFNNNELLRMSEEKGFKEVGSALLKNHHVQAKSSFDKILMEGSVTDIVRYSSDNDLSLYDMSEKVLCSMIRRNDRTIFRRILRDTAIDTSAKESAALRLASETGKLAFVNELLKEGSDPGDRSNESLILACRNNHLEVVKRLLLDERTLPSDQNNKAVKEAVKRSHFEVIHTLVNHQRFQANDDLLVYACKGGYEEFIRILISACFSDIDPTHNKNLSFITACEHGHLNIVKLLLDAEFMKEVRNKVDPADDFNQAFRKACCNGHHKIVEYLLQNPKIDPSDWDNEAILLASREGKVKVVRLLLKDPRVDPTIFQNEPLRRSTSRGHVKVITLLLGDPRIKPKEMWEEVITKLYSRYTTELDKGITKWGKIGENSESTKQENVLMKITNLVLDQKAPPDAGNNALLRYAVWEGKNVVVNILLDNLESEIDPSDVNFQAVYSAIKKRNEGILMKLLSHEKIIQRRDALEHFLKICRQIGGGSKMRMIRKGISNYLSFLETFEKMAHKIERFIELVEEYFLPVSYRGRNILDRIVEHLYAERARLCEIWKSKLKNDRLPEFIDHEFEEIRNFIRGKYHVFNTDNPLLPVLRSQIEKSSGSKKTATKKSKGKGKNIEANNINFVYVGDMVKEGEEWIPEGYGRIYRETQIKSKGKGGRNRSRRKTVFRKLTFQKAKIEHSEDIFNAISLEDLVSSVSGGGQGGQQVNAKILFEGQFVSGFRNGFGKEL